MNPGSFMSQRRVAVPVALLICIASTVFVFLRIANAVRSEEIVALDRAILLWFRDPRNSADPIGPQWFEETVAEITALGGYPVLTVLIASVAGYLVLSRKFGPAAYMLVSIGAGTALSQLLKLVYARPRPDLVNHLVDTFTASFPSGHATMATVVYLTLAALIVLFVGKLRIRIYVVVAAVVLALAVGTSRVYLGVHWPSDVLAGWALGVAWAAFSWLVFTWLHTRRWGEPE
ncbi:MAG: phosphatase PAP2 family protein [Rhizobiaceae bacterium]|nr:phosphatase PAP2 family protein [Rhizobiaceae bacterium]